MFHKLLAIMDQSQTADILTVLDCVPYALEHIGKMLIVHGDGQVEGEFDPGIVKQVLAGIRTTVWVKPVELNIEDSLGRKYRIFWDRLVNHRRAIVFGGGHISQALVGMLSAVNFEVLVVDDRLEFANSARFPSARQVVCESFQNFLQQDLFIDKNTAVIIVTRGHRYDLECLRATMHSQAGYLGMIGSRRRIRELLAVLQGEGAPADLAQRLHAPIGLDIHAETPVEIAVSIVAEVILNFHGGGTGQPLGAGGNRSGA